MGAAIRIVYLRPMKCIKGPATRLPTNAPLGGIEPFFIYIYTNHSTKIRLFYITNVLAQEAMYLVGSRSGFNSFILGTAGEEYPRTSPMQKYDMDTHSESIV